MTKHLRFLIVMLLAMIWSGVMFAQKTETITMADYVPSSNSKAITAEAPLSQNGFKIYIEKKSGNNPGLWNKGNNLRFYDKDILHIESSNGDMTSVEFTVTEGKFNIQGMSSKTWSGTPSASLSFTGSGTNKITVIKITYTDSSSSNKTDTKVSFGENSGNTFTFTEGEYTNGTFTTPTATETTGVAGTIAYSSNNAAVSVNPSTGELSFPGYGEATITATFTPTDAETYDVSTDSYKVVNKADLGDFVFYESFDKCDGKGGNDGTFNGTASKSVVSENKGWIFSNESGANKCIKLGSKNNGGSATTPAINLSGKGILTFKIASWEGDGSEVTISVDNGSLSYNGKNATSFAVSPTDKEWNDINMTISATGAVKIKFSSIAKNRFFLDEVMVKEITTPAVETLTLKESDTNTLEAKTGVNVTLKRSMVANEWNTICLPFDVTAEQATAAFGEGVKIAQLDDTSTGNILNFVDMSECGMEAAVPYLIKPTVAATTEEYSFKGVEIKEAAVTPRKVKTNGNLYFNGIYNKMDVTTDVSSGYHAAFLGANNTIFKAKDGGTMKGFRAYFAIPKSASASALRVVIDGTATSIKNIDSEVVESNAPVYNLQGQRVNGNNLTPGIYVKAGKKFVVK